jgi:hypothetical protein
LYLLLCSINTQRFAGGKIEKDEMGGSCGADGRGVRYAQGDGGEARGKAAIGRPRRGWENNIKMDVHAIFWKKCGELLD